MAFELDRVVHQFRGFSQLNGVRQVGLMVGLAASVAIGLAIVLWAQSPNYGVLYTGLNGKDRAAVTGALGQADINYRIDPSSGAIMVPTDKVYQARIKLATEGLPKGTDSGFDLLDKQQSFATSQFIEQARYNHMLEQELGRSIASLDSVSSARVQLARPKQSVFIRPQNKPTASVLVDLYPGRELDDARVAGIVHLVASSIPGLQPEQVTVVDQSGKLLTGHPQQGDFGMTADQFKLSHRLEASYQQRIINILSPILGPDAVHAQVAADLDFTRVESTKENYNPDKEALRSEQTSQQTTRGEPDGGVPGSLSNQPPPAGIATARQTVASAANQGQAANGNQNSGGAQLRSGRQSPPSKQSGLPTDSRKSATRNYEIDRTISHIRQTPGTVKRLSVAVVVDNKSVTDGSGQSKQVPLSKDEMARITGLVKQAVGFDAGRGDTVTVVNAAFTHDTVKAGAVPSLPFWREPIFQALAKELLAALGVALLLFGVLRPVMKNLAERGGTLATSAGPMGTNELGTADSRSLPEQSERPQLGGQSNSQRPQSIQYAENLAAVKNLAREDPKRVAQVVKSWLGNDE